MFRHTQPSDCTFICDLLREFYAKSGAIYGIPFDYSATLLSVQDVIHRGVCLVGPQSCAGAHIQRFPFGKAMLANVLFWYFKPAREIRIFEALMMACKQAGATHIAAASHFPENRIMRYYERLGLTKIETFAMTSL